MTGGAGGEIERKTAAIANYHAGCLRAIGAQNVGLHDLRATRKAAAACDLGLLAAAEEVLSGGAVRIAPPVVPEDPEQRTELDTRRLEIWERLRELARKAAVESHNKEVTYGAPLLEGALLRARRIEPVLAPLFMQAVEVEVEQDGSIDIRGKDEPPRFNTALWADALGSGDADQILAFGLDVQADLAESWDLERIRTLLNAMHTVFSGLTPETPEGTLAPWPDRPAPADVRDQQPHLRLHEGAGIYLANRASPYLLADLERIGEDPALSLTDDRPVSILVNPPAAQEQPELRSPDIDEVNFPFASNEAQRRVADALDKNRIVVVQGPPGNGKSLTIANLACHFVAQGKSVLVCSHKDQALTVVRDKLEETELQFLYASLIGGTGEAKRELQGQIADVTVFAGNVNADRLRQQLREIEKRRSESGEKYRALRDDFNDRAETEQQEAAELILELEPIATLPARDPVAEDALMAEADLISLDQLARTHREAWSWLLETPASDLADTDTEADLLSEFVDQQRARLEQGRNPRVRELVTQWHAQTEAAPEEIERTQTCATQIEDCLRGPLSELLSESSPTALVSLARKLATHPDLLGDCQAHVTTLREAFAEARSVADARRAVSADPVRRGEVALQHQSLRNLFKRKGARQWLETNAPGAAGLDAETVLRWQAFWDRWSEIQTLAAGLPVDLRTNAPDAYEPELIADLIRLGDRTATLAEGIRGAEQAAKASRLPLGIERVVSDLADAFDAELGAWRNALIALDANQRGEAAKGASELAFARARIDGLDRLLDEHRHEDAERELVDLEKALAALPALGQRHAILNGPAGKLEQAREDIESAALADEDPPPFMRDLALALQRHPEVRRLDEIRAGVSTRQLGERLGELRGEVLEDARRLLGLRIQDRIIKGFRSPRFLASLEAFKKAIRAAAKRFERIEALKSSEEFDVSVLTEVFPCWIMRPEDACRVFPLQPELFDVVIFDEASQCNPDQALPLFARAKRIAIFGDNKQLSNEDLRRSLSSAANRGLIRQADLDQLDRPRLFDQTQNSLLDLVSTRAQATIVLNEHFRCRPEIIAFSNDAFYGNGLRIMRDREDDRGLGPPFLLREVTDVPPLGKSKVNPYEAKLVVAELQNRLDDPRYEGMTFGVLSLFRDQIEHIEELIEAEVPREKRERHRLICSTVDGFQGDERDVILYSWRFATSSSPSILSFTNGETGSQRVNVAVTRARHQAIHFISAPVERFPQGSRNVTGFIQHAKQPKFLMANAAARIHHEPRDTMRSRVASSLSEAGNDVEERYIAGGVSVDLKVADPRTGARIAVFVDSKLDPHPPATVVRRVDGQGLLERAGWRVLRVPSTDVPNADVVHGLAQDALAEAGPRTTIRDTDPAYDTVPSGAVSEEADDAWVEGEIAVEDRADYHWEVPGVEERLRSGEDVFESDFERQLYDRLAADPDLRVVPQWPSRVKRIDLVITDRQGRRLAIEADGDAYHVTDGGSLIPEDISRQELLEEAGWVFHRVLQSAFVADGAAQIAAILAALAEQPANQHLGERVWADMADMSTAGAVDEIEVPEPAPGDPPLNDDATESELPPPAIDEAPSPPKVEPQSTAPAPEDEVVQPEGVSPTAADEHLDGGNGSPPERATATGSQGADFDQLPLDDIPLMVLDLVTKAGELSDQGLIEALASRGITVSHARTRLVRSFTWYLKAKGLLDRSSDDQWTRTSRPDSLTPLCEQSIDELAEQARRLQAQGVAEGESLDRLVAGIAGPSGHVPRPYFRAIGAGIWKATHGPK